VIFGQLEAAAAQRDATAALKIQAADAELDGHRVTEAGQGSHGPVASQSGRASDPIVRLQQLADLRDRGALTDAEFAAEKAKILSVS
jgi:Short C-terminal domain